VHALAERLLKTIRKQDLIRPGDRVAAAVSGGADSVALLLLLLELRSELGIVLWVAHVNHKLRGTESDEDERFVVALARQYALELHTHTAPVNPADPGIEAAARELRYRFFRELAREHRLSKIATAHTLDDQAETVLLRMLRGTGIRGLAGIHPRLTLLITPTLAAPTLDDEQEQTGSVLAEVVRPLLGFRRAELQEFLLERGQSWREDSSNLDLSFLRNRVRHVALPMLAENFGTSVAENLADLAEIARAEDEQWGRIERSMRLFGMAPADIQGAQLPLEPGLLNLPLAARRRLVRAWLESAVHAAPISFRLIEEVLDLAQGTPGQRLELPGGRIIRRTQRDLCFDPPGATSQQSDYEYTLPVPGEVEIPELGIRLQAAIVDPRVVDPASGQEIEPDGLLDPDRLPAMLTVRAWRPGDRFWPAHTKGEKKVKELLNDRHIVGAEKKLWPVVVAGTELVWMRGFPTPANLQPKAGASRALSIRAEAIG
jgi:tRNA(Ile)-lysidine synthase